MLVLRQIEDLKRSFAPDLIHQNGIGGDNFFYLRTANTHRAPLLMTLINDLQALSISKGTVLGHVLHAADWVSTVSSAALAQVRQLIPDLSPRSSVIHNGIESATFPPARIPADMFRVLYLGRLAEQKGIDVLLNAMAVVIRRFPRARLVIAGDGPKRADLEDQVVRLGLSQSIEFLGWVAPQRVPRVISSASMLVIPSRWEGLPNVALQAGLMGRPVVGSRVGGLPEIVDHQQTGILVPPENSDVLSEAIIRLLQNPDTASQMGQAARVKIEREFGWEQYVDSYETLYRKLIRQGQRSSTVTMST
jgi:glycogen(starch) synthase